MANDVIIGEKWVDARARALVRFARAKSSKIHMKLALTHIFRPFFSHTYWTVAARGSISMLYFDRIV